MIEHHLVHCRSAVDAIAVEIGNLPSSARGNEIVEGQAEGPLRIAVQPCVERYHLVVGVALDGKLEVARKNLLAEKLAHLFGWNMGAIFAGFRLVIARNAKAAAVALALVDAH